MEYTSMEIMGNYYTNSKIDQKGFLIFEEIERKG